MVAFHFPKSGNFSFSEEYLVPRGLGDCTIVNDIIYADLYLSAEQIKRLEDEGLVRADVNWYEITPEPKQIDKRDELQSAFKQRPCATVLPEGISPLRVSFTKALSEDVISKCKDLGFTIKAVAPEEP